ncbi:unannotated protein [freshwater metagenome]|uniref:Unannotated protein n=1 Tax=freshwater metagenome TaxID=449393 RepID=A0A6J6WWJ0_9ZZZZ|nr:SRPBCC family protein [Actinomycetota bacterium]
MSQPSKSTVTIEAPVATVRELLFDLPGYPSWTTAIKSVTSDEIASDGKITKVTMVIDAGVMKDRVSLSYDWSKAPEAVSFSLEEADLLTEMTGSYQIKDNGDDTTEVSYELVVKVSMPVPEMMRKKTEQSTVDLALSQLKKRAEA